MLDSWFILYELMQPGTYCSILSVAQDVLFSISINRAVADRRSVVVVAEKLKNLRIGLKNQYWFDSWRTQAWFTTIYTGITKCKIFKSHPSPR